MRKIKSFRYLDFTDIIPKDDFLFNVIIKSLSRDRLLINWGRSFPWSIDDRLSLVSHFDEKTINSINERITENSIIPLIPLFGGMEFLLSFPSYLYLRIERNNCSVINPGAAGADSVIESIIEDYKSIFTNTDSIALDMRYFQICMESVSDNDMISFFKKLSDVVNSLVSETIIVCLESDLKGIRKLLNNSGFNKIIELPVEDRKTFKFNDISDEKAIAVIDDGLEYYFNYNSIDKYVIYLMNIDKVWKNIIYIKNELLKYQIFEYSIRVKNFELRLLFSETERVFQDNLELGEILTADLKGKIINESICRLFSSRQKVIEAELFYLKSGLDNYFIELDNCL